MKTKLLSTGFAVAASVLMLAGCGGGDSDLAGSPTAFSVVPTELTVTGGAAGVCYAGVVGDVFIYGGAPPYRLNNSFPDQVSLNTSVVNDWGGKFTVTYTGGGCIDPGSVTVVDSLNNIVTLTLTNKNPT
jgi:hypothetical protein